MGRDDMKNNPIHLWFDETGFPWERTRREWIRLCGLKRDAEDSTDKWIECEYSLGLEGWTQPLQTDVYDGLPMNTPATLFGSFISLGDDAAENIGYVQQTLSRFLGVAPITTGDDGTLRCRWAFGPASVELQAYYLPMKRYFHPPAEGHACRIEIDTGWRPSLTPQERIWLDSFIPLAKLPFRPEVTLASFDNAPVDPDEMQFVRDPTEPGVSRVFGSIGLSADKAALLFCSSLWGPGWFYIVPMTKVRRFFVERLVPARGGGGSTLFVQCKPDATTRGSMSLKICEAPGPDDLNALAEQIAGALQRPFELGEYHSDC
jgi:hypothetical protein